MTEADILREIRLTLGSLDYVDCFRNSTGVAVTEGRAAMHGLGKGSSDLICIVRNARTGFGVFVAIEVKSTKGRVLPRQAQFLKRIERVGGFGFVVRTAAEATSAVEKVRDL